MSGISEYLEKAMLERTEKFFREMQNDYLGTPVSTEDRIKNLESERNKNYYENILKSNRGKTMIETLISLAGSKPKLIFYTVIIIVVLGFGAVIGINRFIELQKSNHDDFKPVEFESSESYQRMKIK